MKSNIITKLNFGETSAKNYAVVEGEEKLLPGIDYNDAEQLKKLNGVEEITWISPGTFQIKFGPTNG